MNHVKKGNHTSLKQVLFILVNGRGDSAMDLGNRHGPTVQNTQENGKKIELMAKENLFM